jgi:hypothetical protein
MQKAQRIDDLEAVLRAIFASDDERAIELSDKVRNVIERKNVTLEKRIAMLEKILREGGPKKCCPCGAFLLTLHSSVSAISYCSVPT